MRDTDGEVSSMEPGKTVNQTERQSSLHFSLSTLLMVLSLVGFFCAALRFATDFWVLVATSLTLTILAVTLVWQISSPLADRQFWTGFNAAGWIFAALAFTPLLGRNTNAALLTSKILWIVQGYMPFSSPDNVAIEWQGSWFPGSILERRNFQFKIHYSGYGPEWDEWIGPTRIRASGFTEFLQTGNAFFSLLIAATGGILTVLIKRANWRSRFPMKLVLAGAAVVLALVGIVALFIANEILASCLFTLTIAVLTAATIGAATAGPPRSVFLIGFALFGWIYFLVHFSPFGLAFSAYGGAGTAPRLLTSTLIVTAQDWLHPQSNVTMPGATVAWNNYPQDPAASSFQIIAHSQLILIAGVIGGLLGRVFASKRKPET